MGGERGDIIPSTRAVATSPTLAADDTSTPFRASACRSSHRVKPPQFQARWLTLSTRTKLVARILRDLGPWRRDPQKGNAILLRRSFYFAFK